MAYLGQSVGRAGTTLPGPEEVVRAMFVAPDQASGEMYRLKLEMDGYQVALVDYDGALGLLHRGLPDILFLDIRDAGRDDVARYDMVARDPDLRLLPIVLLSHRRAGELAGLGVAIRRLDFLIREPDFITE